MYDILDKPREETKATDLDWVVDLFAKCRGEEAGRRLCEELSSEARATLQEVPGGLRESLVLLAHYLVATGRRP
jgi:hypothetical protein